MPQLVQRLHKQTFLEVLAEPTLEVVEVVDRTITQTTLVEQAALVL
jgi:hypothetical protein